MSWYLLVNGNKQNSKYMEFLIDSTEDINTPPETYDYSLSSIAHTPGYTHIYESDAQGNWVEIGGDS